MAVVRISKGRFDPQRREAVDRLLRQSETALRGPLTQLDGLLRYYVGIDQERAEVSNVSVWDTPDAAHQMSTLREMLDQRPLLEAVGVSFDPISNHESLWVLEPIQPTDAKDPMR